MKISILLLSLTGVAMAIAADSTRFFTGTTNNPSGPPPPPTTLDGPTVLGATTHIDEPKGTILTPFVLRYESRWFSGSTRKVAELTVDLLGSSHQIAVYEQSGRLMTGHVAIVPFLGHTTETLIGDWGPSSNITRRFRMEGTRQIVFTNTLPLNNEIIPTNNPPKPLPPMTNVISNQ